MEEISNVLVSGLSGIAVKMVLVMVAIAVIYVIYKLLETKLLNWIEEIKEKRSR